MCYSTVFCSFLVRFLNSSATWFFFSLFFLFAFFLSILYLPFSFIQSLTFFSVFFISSSLSTSIHSRCPINSYFCPCSYSLFSYIPFLVTISSTVLHSSIFQRSFNFPFFHPSFLTPSFFHLLSYHPSTRPSSSCFHSASHSSLFRSPSLPFFRPFILQFSIFPDFHQPLLTFGHES